MYKLRVALPLAYLIFIVARN